MIQLFLLVILGWPATSQDRPALYAGVYGLIVWVMALVFGSPLGAAVISAVIGFMIALVYYLLLARFSDSLSIWLLILIGVPILIVVANPALLSGGIASVQ